MRLSFKNYISFFPEPNFGLDDFTYFMQALLENQDNQVIIMTQQFASLKKLSTFNFSCNLKFNFFTCAATAPPYELKIIEILHSLPECSFRKSQWLKFISSFTVALRNTHNDYTKSFDLFMLEQDLRNDNSFLVIQDPSIHIHGCCLSSEPALLSQASKLLAEHAIAHIQ